MREIDHQKVMIRTYLSRLHPYPAMVADPLAVELADRYVTSGSRVLDPFCGSGRILAAAERAALRVGVDANPLACLLTRAKLVPARREVIESVLADLPRAQSIQPKERFLAAINGNVDWFSPRVLTDLAKLVTWLNELNLEEHELAIAASALSATVREVSFARQGGWKLHRIREEDRMAFLVSPWERFGRRLKYCQHELARSSKKNTTCFVYQGDARMLRGAVGEHASSEAFDVVITSPPYGDSRTTVQYGAASALCLSIVAHLRGLEHLRVRGSAIDAACLGSKLHEHKQILPEDGFRRYWAGSPNNPAHARVAAFLRDYEVACKGMADLLRPGGKAIIVVGRRSTGSFRLKLDTFTVDQFAANGLRLVEQEKRPLFQKRFPRVINRFARSSEESERLRGRTTTMKCETVLVFERSTIPSDLPISYPVLDSDGLGREVR